MKENSKLILNINGDDPFERPAVDIYHNKQKYLTKQYEGDLVRASNRLFKPIAISHFEIVESKLHEGKECLYAQIYRRDESGNLIKELMVTESYSLIEDLKSMDEDINKKGCLGYTKLVMKKDRSLHATTLTGPEKKKLMGN